MGVEGLLGPAADSAARLLHAALWGGLFIAGVGVACRLLPRLPAGTRAWLWWLACLKLVFDLFWAAPLLLPLLPAPAARLALASPLRAAQLAVIPQPPIAAGPRSTQLAEAGGSHPAPASRGSRFSPALGLLLFWVAGALFSLLAALGQGVRLARTVRAASPALLGDVDLEALAARTGLRRAPRVLQHPDCAAPCVSGWLRPAVLLPPGLARTLTTEELRLTLAHEMAHVKRGDLLLAVVPALARALFFFHPLVWWASAEWGAAREEVCDALALQATGESTADLGHLLLKMASGQVSAPALGLSSGYHGLRRRLVGLTCGARESRPLTRWLLALALPLLLPWRLTAAARVLPAAPPAGAVPSGYSVTDMGAVGGDGVTALNDAGQIAGEAGGADGQAHGFIRDISHAVPTGALPKHHASIAYGINGAGQVAAASYNIPGRGRAFFWDGAPRRIGSLPGYPYSEARGVNDAGQVAGTALAGGHDRWRAAIARAFLWDGGEMTDLGTLGGPYSRAYGINNAGTVVGKADTAVFGQTHAFAWSGGQMQDLGTLGGANSLAYHVNDRGQAVGYSETGLGETRHAFLTTDGVMRDLGTLPGFDDSVAYDVDGAGEAVGAAAPAPDAPNVRALLWRSGHVIDLNRLLPPNSGWTLQEARAINSRGQIVGAGLFRGSPHAFLLTPR